MTHTMILPDPITTTEARLTFIIEGDQVQVSAKVGLLPGAKVLTWKDPEPTADTPQPPAKCYEKKFKGGRADVPPVVRNALCAMSYDELTALARRIGSRPSYLAEIVRNPNRGASKEHLDAIVDGLHPGLLQQSSAGHPLPELPNIEQ